MKSQSYMTRAMSSRDPRFARILGRLGYDTPPPAKTAEEELAEVRAEYEAAMGKRAFHAWDIPTLREKMAADPEPKTDDSDD